MTDEMGSLMKMGVVLGDEEMWTGRGEVENDGMP